MDAHTLNLLEFDKVRAILAEYASTSLGAELARQIEPSKEIGRVRVSLAMVTEMVEALLANQSPPFGGVHDIRLLVRRAAIGTMLTAEQLLQVSDTLIATGAFYRYRMRLDGRLARLIELLAPVEDLGPLGKSITTTIDGRGQVIDAASPELAEVRQKLSVLEEKVQNEIKKLLRDPQLRAILRSERTVNGDHYVLPVAREPSPQDSRRRASHQRHRARQCSSSRLRWLPYPGGTHRVEVGGDREVRRFLRKLSRGVGRWAKGIEAASSSSPRSICVAESAAKYARDYNIRSDICWREQSSGSARRHPCWSISSATSRNHRKKANDRKVVPIDVLGIGSTCCHHGPNTVETCR